MRLNRDDCPEFWRVIRVTLHSALIRGIADLGYSDQDIRKIAGENLIRVMRAAEQAAH
jgi:microsomal dipeptidase-like Zn-dependent dipeptidase